MKARAIGLSLIASLILVQSHAAGASAQEMRITMLVMPAEGNPSHDQLVRRKLAVHLTKARMELVALPLNFEKPSSPPKLTDMDLSSIDLLIHYQAFKREDGIYAVKVWAVEQVSGDTVVQVKGDAGKKRPDRGPSIDRAIDDATNAVGAKLVKGIKTYQESLSKEGSPFRIELRKVPLKAVLAITSLLMKKSLKVKKTEAAKGATAWLIRTKMDSLDLAAAIWKQVEENDPKADDCNFLAKTRGKIILVCKN